MSRRKKGKIFYNYECSISGESFKRYRKVDQTDELISVKSYYELNPENDDRPESVKLEIAAKEEEQRKMQELLGLGETEEPN